MHGADGGAHADDLLRADHRAQRVQRVGGAVGVEDGELCFAAGVAQREAHEKAIELALRQAIGAFLLDRVLRRRNHERHRQLMAVAVGAHLALLHRFEEC